MMSKIALLIVAGSLLLPLAACVQSGPLTPYQQEYYKKQQEYQILGDNRRQDRPCPPSRCK
jgi:hypothetical protein